MRGQERSREDHTEPASIGVRYFELYEDLPAEGKALASPTRYNRETKKWEKITVDTDKLRYVYDRWKGTGGKSGSQVACDYLRGSRRWELIAQSAIFYRGITTGALNKGSSVGVTRYQPGTTTAFSPTITDTVHNEFVNIGASKVVYYLRDGANFYVFAAEC